MDAVAAHCVMPNSSSVVAACFQGLAEYALLHRLGSSPTGLTIVFVDDRIRLTRYAISRHPAVVVFPSLDRHGSSCAPLIARLRSELPDVMVVVLLQRGGAVKGVPEAIRAGAVVHQWSTAEELGSVVQSLRAGASSPPPEPAVLESLLGDLYPRLCVDVLMTCILRAHHHLDVALLAEELRVSRRSLSRWLSEAGWPSPAETIEWGRLLRASVLQWRDDGSVTSLAIASGFRTPEALRRAIRRRLSPGLQTTTTITPLRVATALRRRLQEQPSG